MFPTTLGAMNEAAEAEGVRSRRGWNSMSHGVDLLAPLRRAGIAGIACAALGPWALAGEQGAPPTFVRVETAEHSFTPLHSYAAGKTETGALFFGGLDGMGMHVIFGGTEPAFPVKAYSRSIHLYDDSTETLYSGGVDHLPDSIRRALLVSNIPHHQIGGTLYLFGGYGAELDGSDWTTRATVTAIDLARVEAALRAGEPVPAKAFNVQPSPASQVTGAVAMRMGPYVALIGGHDFSGDYAGVGTPGSNQEYVQRISLFDPEQSMATPAETVVGLANELFRRDMNASPATLPDEQGVDAPGMVIHGGVFNGIFPWLTPVTYRLGDARAEDHVDVEMRMNQYEGPRASFWSESARENRFILFSGLSSHDWNEQTGDWTFNFSTPWTSEITQQRIIAGEWVGDPEGGTRGAPPPVIDTVVGQMPLPLVNGELILNPRLPLAPNGQVLLDELPSSEILLGRIYGGLAAAMPGDAPPTFPSGSIYEIYLVVGVRGDADRDGRVDSQDLSYLLSVWRSKETRVDFNLDGRVDGLDLAFLLGAWGNDTPG